jgi:hypothetical protein
LEVDGILKSWEEKEEKGEGEEKEGDQGKEGDREKEDEDKEGNGEEKKEENEGQEDAIRGKGIHDHLDDLAEEEVEFVRGG